MNNDALIFVEGITYVQDICIYSVYMYILFQFNTKVKFHIICILRNVYVLDLEGLHVSPR